MKKSLFMLIGVLIISLLIMGGCSNSNTDSSANNTPSSTQGNDKAANDEKSNDPIELNVMHWVGSDVEERQLFLDIAEAYTKQNPHVSINYDFQDFGGVEDQRTWITTQLIGGTAPEIFNTRFVWDQEDLEKELIHDLSEYLQEKDYEENMVWGDTFAPTIMNQLVGGDGSYASIPIDTLAVKIMYNKEIFEKAGITAPPITWNEFMEVHEKILKIEKAPFAFPNTKAGDFSYTWSVRLLTEQLIVDNLNEYDFNNNGNIEFNEYIRLVDQGILDLTKPPFNEVHKIMKDWSQYWQRGYNGMDLPATDEMFLRGEAGMVMRHSGQAKQIFQSKARDFEVGMFTFPMLTKDNTPNASENLLELGGEPSATMAIPRTIAPEKLEAAIDYLKFMTSPTIQGKMSLERFVVPVTTNAELPDSMAGFAIKGLKNELNVYAGSFGPEITQNNQRLGQLYLEGSMSLEQYLEDLNKIVVEQAKKSMEENDWNAANNYGIE